MFRARNRWLKIFGLAIVLLLVILLYYKNWHNHSYPFSQAARITAVSYPDRSIWDTVTVQGQSSFHKGLFENGRIRVPDSLLLSSIVLDEQQRIEVFNILLNTTCWLPFTSHCYNPRDALLFYDKNDSIYASIEICLECEKVECSFGCDIHLCDYKNRKIKQFLDRLKR